MKLVSWNTAQKREAWDVLGRDRSLDIALLQEGRPPPASIPAETVPATDGSWRTAGSGNRSYCAAVARLSDRVKLQPIETVPVGERLHRHQLGASRVGTIAAADIELESGELITVVSMHAAWEDARDGSWIYADASMHRIISDLSVFIGRQRGHKVIAAGDLNLMRGYGDGGSAYWAARYATVFARMEAVGLPLVGPWHPNGRKADPRPAELPEDSDNVPTFKTKSGAVNRQLDYVFASPELHARLAVRALNSEEEWGPSDHCRIEISLSS